MSHRVYRIKARNIMSNLYSIRFSRLSTFAEACTCHGKWSEWREPCEWSATIATDAFAPQDSCGAMLHLFDWLYQRYHSQSLCWRHGFHALEDWSRQSWCFYVGLCPCGILLHLWGGLFSHVGNAGRQVWTTSCAPDRSCRLRCCPHHLWHGRKLASGTGSSFDGRILLWKCWSSSNLPGWISE